MISRDAGHLGGNRVHQHRRGIRSLAAGDIDADPVERRDALAQHGAVGLGIGKAVQFLLLALVEHADALGRRLQRRALRRGQAAKRGLQLGWPNVEARHAGAPPCMRSNLLVYSARRRRRALDVGQDGGHGRLDGVVGRRFEGQQRGQVSLKPAALESSLRMRSGHDCINFG